MFFRSTIKEIDAPVLQEWLEGKSSSFRIIDVRSPQEIAGGTIPGAEAMPLNLHEFDPKETYVFICRSGARSAQACMFMQQRGFEDVYNLRGGMIGWAQNGGQIVALKQAV
jgi:rhodanese-related sulfurtransferase